MAEEQLVASLDALRRQIDELDEALVRLLNARAACALEIGRVKKQIGPGDLPARPRGRGARARAEHQPGPAGRRAPIRRLFERIIDEARRLERMRTDSDGDPDEIDEPVS